MSILKFLGKLVSRTGDIDSPLGVPSVILDSNTGMPVDSDHPLPVSIAGGSSITLTGPVSVGNEVEIKNDTGSPIPTKDINGAGAATITTNTTAVAGAFSAITVLSDAVFTSLTRANTTGSLGSLSVPAGVTLYGSITGYKLASGAVIAYGA